METLQIGGVSSRVLADRYGTPLYVYDENKIRYQAMTAAEPGDLLAVFSTGAYGYSMASNYNRLGRPAVVFAKDGEARSVIRRETYEDQYRLEV